MSKAKGAKAKGAKAKGAKAKGAKARTTRDGCPVPEGYPVNPR